MFQRFIILFLAICVFSFYSQAQKATPTPTQTPIATGKSYTSGEIKRPTTTAPQFPSPVTFTDFSANSKIDFKHSASVTAIKYMPETMAAGVAMFDFDNDGRQDLFFTNGALIVENQKDNKLDKSNPKFWNRLYRQKSDGTFEDVTEKAGVKGEGYSFGTAVGDFNKDGFQDLFVTNYGSVNLYQNNGNGTFTDVTKKLGVNVEGWATSTGWFDYDKDGRLDLFLTRYVVWDFELGNIFCGDTRPGYRAYCHPDNFKPISSLLLRQKQDGTFEDVTEKSGISKSKGKGLGVAFADFDDDGWTDIFVANDNIDQHLFHNLQDGTFEEVALPAGVAFDERGRRFSGMGIDVADYDGDGKQDVIITALSNETYPLYKNMGDLVFDYVTQTSGIAQITILGAGWGIKFVDVDNDGRRDVFVAQSHVLDTIEKTTSFLKYKQTPLLMRNTEKGFQNISAASGEIFQKDFSARGMATGDLDNDGDIDVVISQTDGTPVILKNSGTKNHWIGFDLRGEKSTPNGEGSRLILTEFSGRKQVFDISNSGSYLSANDHRLIVGLGTADKIKQVEIRWTNGETKILQNLEVDKYHRINEK
ncbi:MAG: CRTAC1 family protein [Pyrinomonadaceae bacterium]|jgi:hypothetical protein|nr:CRTAC1 family protein [Pyrinomonadaceae bacterium]